MYCVLSIVELTGEYSEVVLLFGEFSFLISAMLLLLLSVVLPLSQSSGAGVCFASVIRLTSSAISACVPELSSGRLVGPVSGDLVVLARGFVLIASIKLH